MVDVGDLDFSDPGVAFDSAIEFGLRWLDFDDPAAAADPLPGDAPEPLHRFWDAFGGKTVNGRSATGPRVEIFEPAVMRRDRADDTGHDLLVFAAYGGAAMGWATAIGTDLADPPMFEDSDQTDGWELVNDSLVRFLTGTVFLNAASLGHTGELPASYWQSVKADIDDQQPVATFGLHTPNTGTVWTHPDGLIVVNDTTLDDNPVWTMRARTADTVTALQGKHGRPGYTEVQVTLGKRTDEWRGVSWELSFFADGSASLPVYKATAMELPPGTFDFEDVVTQSKDLYENHENTEEGRGLGSSISLRIGHRGTVWFVTDDAAKSLGDLVLDRIERSPEFNENWETARPEIYR